MWKCGNVECGMDPLLHSTFLPFYTLFSRDITHHIFRRVVRRLFGDPDIVDMAFPKAGSGNPHKLRTFMEFSQGMRSDIAHTGAYPAHQLMDGIMKRSFIGNATLHAFRHK